MVASPGRMSAVYEECAKALVFSLNYYVAGTRETGTGI
jgi:hypothetical protein